MLNDSLKNGYSPSKETCSQFFIRLLAEDIYFAKWFSLIGFLEKFKWEKINYQKMAIIPSATFLI